MGGPEKWETKWEGPIANGCFSSQEVAPVTRTTGLGLSKSRPWCPFIDHLPVLRGGRGQIHRQQLGWFAEPH